MTRNRFKLSACGSSRGGYVARAHQRYMRELHLKNEAALVNIEIHIPKRYFVKCFGKLVQVTEREAAMLKQTMDIIIKLHGSINLHLRNRYSNSVSQRYVLILR